MKEPNSFVISAHDVASRWINLEEEESVANAVILTNGRQHLAVPFAIFFGGKGYLVVFILLCSFQVHKIHNMTDDISLRVTDDSKVTLDAGLNLGETTTIGKMYHLTSHSSKVS